MTFVLAVDLDGVSGKYVPAFRESVARDLNVDPSTLPEPTSWNFADCGWGIRDTAHYMELHENAVQRGLFRWMAPMEGVSKSLWHLSDEGVHIRILTHRLCTNGFHRTAAADTVEWLETTDIPYRDICFVANKKDVGADAYIDDAPHNVTSLREAGRYVIVFDAPYNQHLPGPRAHNWDEAVELIMARKAALEAQQAVEVEYVAELAAPLAEEADDAEQVA